MSPDTSCAERLAQRSRYQQRWCKLSVSLQQTPTCQVSGQSPVTMAASSCTQLPHFLALSVNERAPLRSELNANSLAMDQLLSVITPACTNLPAVVTSRHKERLIRVFLTVRAYRIVQLCDDQHRCNDSANRLTLRQSLQKK